MSEIYTLLHIDTLSIIMLSLLTVVGFNVYTYSYRYLDGYSHSGQYKGALLLLLLLMAINFTTNNIFVMTVSWTSANLVLTRIMVLKKNWAAAQNSASIARFILLLSSFSLFTALMILYCSTGYTQISIINSTDLDRVTSTIFCSLLITAAMIQSAIWPFHKWLISSLNSPTQTSAVMHAGVINGGGFLLAKFSPILIMHENIMAFVFCIGIVTTVYGTTCKLLRTDAKGTLACSTVGQMGYMFIQCGLGLFSAAIAHLVWHGCFKAYLFLCSAAPSTPPKNSYKNIRINKLVNASALALTISTSFSYMAGINIKSLDSNFFIVSIVTIASCQALLPIMQFNRFSHKALGYIATLLVFTVYGIMYYQFDQALINSVKNKIRPLNIIHFSGIFILTACWLIVLFKERLSKQIKLSRTLGLYVWLINSSQPLKGTTTLNRSAL